MQRHRIHRPSPSKPRTYRHKDCRKHFTVTTKTCMHATKRPLRDWMFAIYLVMTARKGVSAIQLSKELGCQYRTAWHTLHRIREACGRGEFTLRHAVEVDETHVGGKRKNMSNAKRKDLAGTGRDTVGKVVVAGVRERGGRVAATPDAHTDAATLVIHIESIVEPGATKCTDEATTYIPLGYRYQTEAVRHSLGEYVRGDMHTISMGSVWSVLKRSIHGTWHHVSPKHLGKYVNEATFRLNEGNCEIDTIDRGGVCPSGGRGATPVPRPDGRQRPLVPWGGGLDLLATAHADVRHGTEASGRFLSPVVRQAHGEAPGLGHKEETADEPPQPVVSMLCCGPRCLEGEEEPNNDDHANQDDDLRRPNGFKHAGPSK